MFNCKLIRIDQPAQHNQEYFWRPIYVVAGALPPLACMYYHIIFSDTITLTATSVSGRDRRCSSVQENKVDQRIQIKSILTQPPFLLFLSLLLILPPPPPIW